MLIWIALVGLLALAALGLVQVHGIAWWALFGLAYLLAAGGLAAIVGTMLERDRRARRLERWWTETLRRDLRRDER